MESFDLESEIERLGPPGRRSLTTMDGCHLGIARFSSHPRWERHQEGDELLHVLAGRMELTVLTADGPVESTLVSGSVAVVPRGCWHSPRPVGEVTLLYVSPTSGNEVCDDLEPPG